MLTLVMVKISYFIPSIRQFFFNTDRLLKSPNKRHICINNCFLGCWNWIRGPFPSSQVFEIIQKKSQQIKKNVWFGGVIMLNICFSRRWNWIRSPFELTTSGFWDNLKKVFRFRLSEQFELFFDDALDMSLCFLMLIMFKP